MATFAVRMRGRLTAVGLTIPDFRGYLSTNTLSSIKGFAISSRFSTDPQ